MPGLASMLKDGGVLIGMVHVRALPGAPFHALGLEEIAARAAREARALADAGFDAVILENMHDRPFVHGSHGPEIVACMTRVGLSVRDAARRGGSELPVGVQVLSGGNREAIAIARAIGGEFIRCENFVFAHVADEGLLPAAEAGPLLRYRRSIGAEGVLVFADIKKKHASHAITGDVSLADSARSAAFFGADGVIVTGKATGEPTRVEDAAEAADAVDLPVLVGSGVTPASVAPLMAHADGLIVGSFLKATGRWDGDIDPRRCREIVEARDRARKRA